jgi:hypothetical protein
LYWLAVILQERLEAMLTHTKPGDHVLPRCSASQRGLSLFTMQMRWHLKSNIGTCGASLMFSFAFLGCGCMLMLS